MSTAARRLPRARRIRSGLTYANLTSTLALILALATGGAYAASSLAPRSVGERQLRPGAVTPDKIRRSAVTAPKIAALAVKKGKLAAGSVGPSNLADAATTTSKLAIASVITEKIAPEAVTGDKLNEKTLGQVPSADVANRAAFAEAADPAAFAHIDQAGNIDSPSSRAIAAIHTPETGVHCLSVAGFNPRGAQVTPQFNGVSTTTAFVRIGGAALCPAPEVEIQTWSGGSKVEAPFFFVAYR